jgi:hypothetical protein
MRRIALALLLGLAADAGALANPLTSGGVLVDRMPLARPEPVPESGDRPAAVTPAPDQAPLPDGMALGPGTVLKPGFFGPSGKDAGLDGPAGGALPRGLGDALLDAGPGIVLQRKF